MRKLYIHQHAADLRGASVVQDEHGNSIYLLVGKWGLRQDVLSLYDLQGQVLAEVKQLSFGLLPKFSIYENQQQVGTVGKSLGFVREMIYIRGLNWIIVGNIISNRYKVFHGTTLIFSLAPVKYSGGDYHELIVEHEEDEPVSIVIASVLDHWSRKKERHPKRIGQREFPLDAQRSFFVNFKK